MSTKQRFHRPARSSLLRLCDGLFLTLLSLSASPADANASPSRRLTRAITAARAHARTGQHQRAAAVMSRYALDSATLASGSTVETYEHDAFEPVVERVAGARTEAEVASALRDGYDAHIAAALHHNGAAQVLAAEGGYRAARANIRAAYRHLEAATAMHDRVSLEAVHRRTTEADRASRTAAAVRVPTRDADDDPPSVLHPNERRLLHRVVVSLTRTSATDAATFSEGELQVTLEGGVLRLREQGARPEWQEAVIALNAVLQTIVEQPRDARVAQMRRRLSRTPWERSATTPAGREALMALRELL